MKIIKTKDSDLHLRIAEIMKRERGLSEKEQYQRRREAFMREVHETLGWNYIPESKSQAVTLKTKESNDGD